MAGVADEPGPRWVSMCAECPAPSAHFLAPAAGESETDHGGWECAHTDVPAWLPQHAPSVCLAADEIVSSSSSMTSSGLRRSRRLAAFEARSR